MTRLMLHHKQWQFAERAGAANAAIANSDASNETVLRYRINNTADSQTRAYLIYRFTDWSNYEWVRIYPSSIQIGKNVAGAAGVISTGGAVSTQDTWYTLRIVADGANVKVYRWADGAMPSLVCSTTGSPNQSTTAFRLSVVSGYLFDFDEIRVLADSLSNTTTFTVNDANELLTMTDRNGTTTFTFDDWGRMTGKQRGSYSARYDYKLGQKLVSYTSNWPDPSNISFSYAGDLRCATSTIDGTFHRFRWSDAYTPTSSDNDTGSIERFYVGRTLAEATGSSPAAANWKYYVSNAALTVSSIYDHARSAKAAANYSPYGQIIERFGAEMPRAFGGFPLFSELLYTPYRHYDPMICRWITRDPYPPHISSNLYSFTNNCPNSNVDLKGDGVQGVVIIVVILGALVGGYLAADCAGSLHGALGYWGSSATKPEYQQDDPIEDVSPQEASYREFMRHCGAACEVTHTAGIGSRCVTWTQGLRNVQPTEAAAENIGVTVPLPQGTGGSLVSIRSACEIGCKQKWNLSHPYYEK